MSRLLSRVLQWCTAAVVRCHVRCRVCSKRIQINHVLVYSHTVNCPLSSVLCPFPFLLDVHTRVHTLHVHTACIHCRSGMRKRRWVGNGRHRSASGRGERQTGGNIHHTGGETQTGETHTGGRDNGGQRGGRKRAKGGGGRWGGSDRRVRACTATHRLVYRSS